MRYALLPILLAVCSCSHHTCTDGGTHVTKFSDSYRSCDLGCVHGDKKGRVKECRCSATCPCWKQEGHPGVQKPEPAVVVVQPGQSQPADALCPKCGRSNAVGWNFCNTCGYKRQ
jgi:hypothetical protein